MSFKYVAVLILFICTCTLAQLTKGIKYLESDYQEAGLPPEACEQEQINKALICHPVTSVEQDQYIQDICRAFCPKKKIINLDETIDTYISASEKNSGILQMFSSDENINLYFNQYYNSLLPKIEEQEKQLKSLIKQKREDPSSKNIQSQINEKRIKILELREQKKQFNLYFLEFNLDWMENGLTFDVKRFTDYAITGLEFNYPKKNVKVKVYTDGSPSFPYVEISINGKNFKKACDGAFSFVNKSKIGGNKFDNKAPLINFDEINKLVDLDIDRVLFERKSLDNLTEYMIPRVTKTIKSIMTTNLDKLQKDITLIYDKEVQNFITELNKTENPVRKNNLRELLDCLQSGMADIAKSEFIINQKDKYSKIITELDNGDLNPKGSLIDEEGNKYYATPPDDLRAENYIIKNGTVYAITPTDKSREEITVENVPNYNDLRRTIYKAFPEYDHPDLQNPRTSGLRMTPNFNFNNYSYLPKEETPQSNQPKNTPTRESNPHSVLPKNRAKAK